LEPPRRGAARVGPSPTGPGPRKGARVRRSGTRRSNRPGLATDGGRLPKDGRPVPIGRRPAWSASRVSAPAYGLLGNQLRLRVVHLPSPDDRPTMAAVSRSAPRNRRGECAWPAAATAGKLAARGGSGSYRGDPGGQ